MPGGPTKRFREFGRQGGEVACLTDVLDHCRQVKGEEEFEEEERLVSPVHSLAIQQESLWGLSGTESGNINLCSLRHEPGQLRHVLRQHTSAVSALALTNDDTELISGGWDRSVHVSASVNGRLQRTHQ